MEGILSVIQLMCRYGGRLGECMFDIIVIQLRFSPDRV